MKSLRRNMPRRGGLPSQVNDVSSTEKPWTGPETYHQEHQEVRQSNEGYPYGSSNQAPHQDHISQYMSQPLNQQLGIPNVEPGPTLQPHSRVNPESAWKQPSDHPSRRDESLSEISGLTTHDPPIFQLKSEKRKPQETSPNAQIFSFLFKFMEGCLQVNPDLNKIKPRWTIFFIITSPNLFFLTTANFVLATISKQRTTEQSKPRVRPILVLVALLYQIEPHPVVDSVL